MTVEIYRSSPAEISRITLSSPVTGQPSRRTQPREPEKASVGDDDDFTLEADPPPPQWPRIFPSL
jgi:hypothetical protein